MKHAGKETIAILDGILWDKNVSKENKKRIYDTNLKTIITYNQEVLSVKETL